MKFNKALVDLSPKENIKEIDGIILSKFDIVEDKGFFFYFKKFFLIFRKNKKKKKYFFKKFCCCYFFLIYI